MNAVGLVAVERRRAEEDAILREVVTAAAAATATPAMAVRAFAMVSTGDAARAMQDAPRLVADHAVGRRSARTLHRLHRVGSARTKDAVDIARIDAVVDQTLLKMRPPAG